MTRFEAPALALLLVAFSAPASAQDNPPEVVDCPEFSTPDGEGDCICDDGYDLHAPTLTCVLSPCPENTERAPGREDDPRGCICLPGYKWEEAPEDHPDPESFEAALCVEKAACEEPGAVRDDEDECVCAENATGEFETDEDGVITLISCECDEGYVFNPTFYTCRATDEQCPAHSHPDPGIPAEGEGEEDLDGMLGDCRCDDGYVWTRAEEACTLIISDCGPNSHPSPQGTGCECNEGFHPAPTGVPGCVGEELCGRCVAHAHPKGDTGDEGEGEGPVNACECECNTGFQGEFEGAKLVQCTLEIPPCGEEGGPDCPKPPGPSEEGEGETGGNTEEGCFNSVAAGVGDSPSPGLLLVVIGLGLALLARPRR